MFAGWLHSIAQALEIPPQEWIRLDAWNRQALDEYAAVEQLNP